MWRFLVNLPMYELSENVDELYRSGRELNYVQITQKLLAIRSEIGNWQMAIGKCLLISGAHIKIDERDTSGYPELPIACLS